ncbi:GNAT family N-acetyltransferase [Nocardiopsis sp. NPDC101807]|uniref:GNAT family N-acetyltransferase n=1 Tax=Nocardiopsis sp. NPDC101807 TaxID=3364339 RepID=UPI003819C854
MSAPHRGSGPGVVPGTENEHAACADLWTRALAHRDGTAPDPAVRDRVLRKLGTPPHLLLVLRPEEGCAPAGFSLSLPPAAGDPSHTAYLAFLALDPDHQGRGWGRRLLAATLDRLSGAADAVTLEVLPDNAAARALYESTGWRATGEGRFEGSGRSSVVYRLDLDRG